MKCENCGHEIETDKADRVSIHGIYDMHLFHRYTGATVDEVIANWRQHISEPIPAMVGDREIEDMGPTDLCDAIVLSDKKELRRVGGMVFADSETRAPRDENAVERYRQALLADPDIPQLLAEGYNTSIYGQS